MVVSKFSVMYLLILLMVCVFADIKIISPNRKASEKEFPYLCVIRQKDFQEISVCGGSVISAKNVLTAAHCVANQSLLMKSKIVPRSDLETFTIVAGSVNADGKGPGAQLRKISAVVFPKNVKINGMVIEDDVAMIVTKRKFIFNDYVMPAKFMPFDGSNAEEKYQKYVKSKCLFAGWGCQNTTTNPFTKEMIPFNPSKTLMVTYVTTMKPRECQQLLCSVKRDNCRSIVFSWDKLICAMGAKKENDVCAGDSGSPLICEGPSRSQHIVGILSFVETNFGCGKGFPSGYVSGLAIENFLKTEFYNVKSQATTLTLNIAFVAAYIINLN